MSIFNAALVINKVPVLGLVGVRKEQAFFIFSGESYLIEGNETKINCQKKTKK